MSVQAMAWVLQDEHTTRGPDRLVLLALANHANEDAQCWIGVATIMREANIAQERTARAALRALEAAGLIATERQAAPDSRIPANRRPNLYTILALHAAPPQEDLGGARGASRGGARRVSGGARGAGQTVREPSVEPLELVPADVPSAPSERSATRRTRVTGETLTEGRRAFGLRKGMAAVVADAEWERFVDYHEARGSLMASWDAAWRTWVGFWTAKHAAPAAAAAGDGRRLRSVEQPWMRR